MSNEMYKFKIKLLAIFLSIGIVMSIFTSCNKERVEDNTTVKDIGGRFTAVVSSKVSGWDVGGNRIVSYIVYDKETKILYYWIQGDGDLCPYITEEGYYAKWINGEIIPIK